MKKYEERKITYTKDVLVTMICDWCKKEFMYLDDEPFFEDFKLEYKPYYDGYGDYHVRSGNWYVELCPECIEKLKVYLESQNVTIQDYY